MYHTFLPCDMGTLVTIDNMLIRSFERTGKMKNYAAYVDEVDAEAILGGKRMAEVSFIGNCSYQFPFGRETTCMDAFVCQTNVNLRHLAGLAINAFMRNDPIIHPKEVLVIPNLRLGNPEDPEWVAGGTTAVVIGFAVRNESCEYGRVSRGRVLALAKDAGNRLVFCVIDTGTDFEEAKLIRTSRMCPVEFSDTVRDMTDFQNIVPGIPANMKHQFDLLMHDASVFAATAS